MTRGLSPAGAPDGIGMEGAGSGKRKTGIPRLRRTASGDIMDAGPCGGRICIADEEGAP